MVLPRILCVAEKPSIAKAVAGHLAGGEQPVTQNVPGVPWVKNYEFEYTFPPPWGACRVTMTSVTGHLISLDFGPEYRNWQACSPWDLFDAPIRSFVEDDKKAIATNIEKQARYCKALFIWTDCDREGEHIGTEIRDTALKVKPSLDVKRAQFSNIERAHIINAARHPVPLDERQADAVAARQELDLRIGVCFTRWQSLTLKPIIAHVQELQVISYGSCQFPTLGFVVDRYFRVQNFVPEPFWGIAVTHHKDDAAVKFHWKRVHLFDRMTVVILYERCIIAKHATVTRVTSRPTSKWRPLPLTTVELQKMGSRYLRMDSQRVMKIAEDLYTKGWISYPRTETDQFDSGMDLQALIRKQTHDATWGTYAEMLLNEHGAYRQPRAGRNNDRAHPPIHPVNHVERHKLNDEEWRVYEFVVRRFLACCSDDAKGQSTTVTIMYGEEEFTATGLVVLERNYLDVYPFDKWESSQVLPDFQEGERFEPSEALMTEGKTTPPGYLTEPELIALMDANGIGTDATMADHIAKIKERSYVATRAKSGGNSDADSGAPTARGRGRGRGRGSRGGRGGGIGRGGASGGTTTGVQEFIPTTLGVALIQGYDQIGLDTNLGKPFLRKEMERQMTAICTGNASRRDVVQQTLEQYREVYVRTTQQVDVLKDSFRKYILSQSPPH